MSAFKIAITKTGVEITLNEVIEEVDVIDKLHFNEDLLEHLLETHSGDQAYWEALAIRLKKRAEAFDDEVSSKWWANNRFFAKFVLQAYGEKEPTKSSIDDMTILIYSRDTSPDMLKKYVHMAYAVFSTKKGVYAQDSESFEKNMLKFINDSDPPWYIETVKEMQRKLQEDFELVKVFAERLNSRSFQMKEYQNLLMAKKYNVGPTSFSDKEMLERINQNRKRKG